VRNVFQIVNNRDNNRTENFSYDTLNRVATASTQGPNWGEAFTIDAWGNLTNRGPVAGKTTYEPLSAPATNQNQLTGFGYDAAGNMTSNGSATYTYDMESRLKTTAGATYIYDGDGQRVKKAIPGVTLYWYGATGNVLDETNGSGTLVSEYIFFNGKRVARRDADNSVHYYLSDNLGSASVITSATGVVTEESDYYPYGGEIPIVNTDPNHYKFTGKERDAESGLDNFGARYFTSNIGRFMTPDWAARPTTVPHAVFGDPQSLNLYGYVRNDPISQVDPDGHGCVGSLTGGPPNDVVGSGGPPCAAAAQPLPPNGICCAPPGKQNKGPVAGYDPNRQPDGSYKATPAQLAEIYERLHGGKNGLIGNGQCVTACSKFSGVPPTTRKWQRGRPATELTDADKGTAIATFDENGQYFPTSVEKNSGIYMGTSTKGSFHFVDQWPTRTDHGRVIREAVPPQERTLSPNGAYPSDNSNAYYVILVPEPK
jgi:RHS repeat-associated protein